MSTIAITGMHRSGTSLLARVVNLLGVHLGTPHDHLAANEANPTGYWEHRGVVRVDNEVLAELGGDWAGPPYLPPGWEHSADLERQRRRATTVLSELRADAEVVGFKDPRASLLLPLWREVTDLDAVVACVRPPSGIVRSLQRRNGLGEAHVAALTTRYLTSLVANAPELYVVRYDELLAASPTLLRDLAAHLGLPTPGEDTLAEVASFVRADLDHDDGATAGTPELRLAERVTEQVLDLPRHREELIDLAATLNQAAASDGRAPGRVGARATRLAETQEELTAARRRLRRVDGEVVALQEELAEQRAARRRAERQLDRLRSRRSVKLALALAGLTRPVHRLLRRLRRR